MSLDSASIEQQAQLAVLAALETTAEAARLGLIARHRDFFELGDDAEETAAKPAAPQIAGELVDQAERVIQTIRRYHARILCSDSQEPF
jgi:4'-phosphopantetheinyl transferase EntD